MKKILISVLITICVIATSITINANAFSGDNLPSNQEGSENQIRVTIDALDSPIHVQDSAYYFFSYGGWMATTVPESWQVENKETDKYLLQYYLYDGSMFDINNTDITNVKHYTEEVSAVGAYQNDVRVGNTTWSGFQPLIQGIQKIAATKGEIPGFENLTGENGWYIKTQAMYDAGQNLGAGYLNAYDFQGTKFYLCLDAEIKYHNFKIAAVYSDKSVESFDAFTIEMPNECFSANDTEGAIVKYNAEDYKYLTVKEDTAMSTAFGADNVDSSWSNWYRGTN